MGHGEKEQPWRFAFPELEQESCLLNSPVLNIQVANSDLKIKPSLQGTDFPLSQNHGCSGRNVFSSAEEGNENLEIKPSLPNLCEEYVWVDYYSFFFGFLLSHSLHSNVFNPSPLLRGACMASVLPTFPLSPNVLLFCSLLFTSAQCSASKSPRPYPTYIYLLKKQQMIDVRLLVICSCSQNPPVQQPRSLSISL